MKDGVEEESFCHVTSRMAESPEPQITPTKTPEVPAELAVMIADLTVLYKNPECNGRFSDSLKSFLDCAGELVVGSEFTAGLFFVHPQNNLMKKLQQATASAVEEVVENWANDQVVEVLMSMGAKLESVPFFPEMFGVTKSGESLAKQVTYTSDQDPVFFPELVLMTGNPESYSRVCRRCKKFQPNLMDSYFGVRGVIPCMTILAELQLFDEDMELIFKRFLDASFAATPKPTCKQLLALAMTAVGKSNSIALDNFIELGANINDWMTCNPAGHPILLLATAYTKRSEDRTEKTLDVLAKHDFYESYYDDDGKIFVPRDITDLERSKFFAILAKYIYRKQRKNARKQLEQTNGRLGVLRQNYPNELIYVFYDGLYNTTPLSRIGDTYDSGVLCARLPDPEHITLVKGIREIHYLPKQAVELFIQLAVDYERLPNVINIYVAGNPDNAKENPFSSIKPMQIELRLKDYLMATKQLGTEDSQVPFKLGVGSMVTPGPAVDVLAELEYLKHITGCKGDMKRDDLNDIMSYCRIVHLDAEGSNIADSEMFPWLENLNVSYTMTNVFVPKNTDAYKSLKQLSGEASVPEVKEGEAIDPVQVVQTPQIIIHLTLFRNELMQVMLAHTKSVQQKERDQAVYAEHSDVFV